MVIKTIREGGIDDALIRESMFQIGYDFPDEWFAIVREQPERATGRSTGHPVQP